MLKKRVFTLVTFVHIVQKTGRDYKGYMEIVRKSKYTGWYGHERSRVNCSILR